jgi:hypothetical protein
MLMGGHSHGHAALANLSDQQQRDDLSRCAELLRSHLHPQSWWPFCYPYGKPATFNELTRRELQRQGFCCAFATEVGTNEPRRELFAIRRIDPKDVQP